MISKCPGTFEYKDGKVVPFISRFCYCCPPADTKSCKTSTIRFYFRAKMALCCSQGGGVFLRARYPCTPPVPCNPAIPSHPRNVPSRFRAKREQRQRVSGLELGSRGQNLALAVSHVPYSFDSCQGGIRAEPHAGATPV